MSKKFDLIIETALRRYQGPNFLVGDRIKIIDNWKSHDWMRSQPELKLERLSELIESGDNIRVSAVKAIRPATADSGHFQDVDGFYVDVVREAAPGLFMSSQVFTLPQELLEHIDDGINLAGDTPDSQIRQDTSQIKPEVPELEPVHKLPDEHTDTSLESPAQSYTADYMEG